LQAPNKRMRTVFFPILLIGACVFLFSQPLHVYAQTVPQDVQTATQSATPSLDSQSSANLIISAIEDFFKSLDKAGGGFIFSTPDLFTNTITLADGTAIQGLNVYRNIFYILSVPLSAFIIFWFSLRGMASQEFHFLKQFSLRIFLYIFLLLFLVPILSLSVQTENLLTTAILSASSNKEQSISAFVTDYFTSVNQEVSSGIATAESLGFPNPSFFDMMRSISHVITQLFFFILILFFLTLGILFIFMQFIIRFLSLLFLSLVFPLVSPFIFSERTERIVGSFFRLWCTLLIHQPSFALGYIIVLLISKSLLQHGASVGLLVLYTASLFFLGTVNILASRIFADFWISAGINLEAAAITGVGRRFITGSSKFLWGNKEKIFDRLGKPKTITFPKALAKKEPPQASITGTGEYSPQNQQLAMNIKTKERTGTIGQDLAQTRERVSRGAYREEFSKKGFITSVQDKTQGMVSIEGTGYSYYDKGHNLTYIYPSRQDAIESGIPTDKISKTPLPKRSYIDLSHFNKGDNLHNAYATQEAIRLGKPSTYAHVTQRSDPERIKHFLELTRERNASLGIDGVLVKRYDNFAGKRSKKATTRIVTVGKPEKLFS